MTAADESGDDAFSVNWHGSSLVINPTRGWGFDDTELHENCFSPIVQIQWNYDTQPYVPYTVPQQHVHAQKNQMYKAQYAFNVSMIMCPAVHMATRSLLRSSSTHEPSDPLSRVKILVFTLYNILDVDTWCTLGEEGEHG
jgi:hypothetical protein